MRKFFKTVAIVTVFSVCEKFLGFLYRIFLSKTIGSEGLGLYQVSLSLFGLILTVCVSGIPITVSRLMTKYNTEKRFSNTKKVISAGIILSVVITLPISLIILFSGNLFSFLFADARCLKLFKIIMPSLTFTSVYAVLRGVFWGNKDFLPYSVIELIEEAVMIIVGVILVSSSSTALEGSIGASIGVLVSFLVSFTLGVIAFFIRKNKIVNPVGEIKPLLKSSLPVTAMRTSGSVINSIMSIVLPIRLVASGFSNGEAMSLYGQAVGQTLPLISIPSTLIASFNLVLIPEISEDYYSNRHHYLKCNVEKAIKFASLIPALFIPVFTVFGEEIGVIVFSNAECGKYLSFSAIVTVLLSLSSYSASIMDSMGEEKRALFNFLLGSFLMLLCIFFLPKYIGIYSLTVGLIITYSLTGALNLIKIKRKLKEKPKYFRYIGLSLTIPFISVIIGFILKKLLLFSLGSYFCLIIIGGLITAITLLMFILFKMISINGFALKLKSVLSKKLSPTKR